MKLFVAVLVCMVACTFADNDDLYKRLLNLLKDKEEKREESVQDVMKRILGDQEENLMKRHTCDSECGSNTNYKVDISGDCLCYNRRKELEGRGCVEECQAQNELWTHGFDIDGKGCQCYEEREIIAERRHTCSEKCGNGYIVDVDGKNCQCLQKRGLMETRGCNEDCKDKNALWGLDIGDKNKGCTCFYQRDLFNIQTSEPVLKRGLKCNDKGDCARESYCADINGKGKQCVGTRELERAIRCSACTLRESCLDLGGKRGLRCVRKRDLEALLSKY